MYKPVLELHPFFEHYNNEYPQMMRKLCHFATERVPILYGEILFHIGEIPHSPKMFFLEAGDLMYVAQDGRERSLCAGEWFCEAALWTSSWVHVGMVRATSNSMLVALDAAKFEEAVRHFEHIDFSPEAYGTGYVEYLNEVDQKGEEKFVDVELSNGKERQLVNACTASPGAFPRFSMVSSVSRQSHMRMSWLSHRSSSL